MAGFTADPAALAEIATTLRDSGSTLDSAGGSPPVPQAGEVSGAVCTAMTALCEAVLSVVAGLTVSGDAVADSAAAYTRSDQPSGGHDAR